MFSVRSLYSSGLLNRPESLDRSAGPDTHSDIHSSEGNRTLTPARYALEEVAVVVMNGRNASADDQRNRKV